MTDDKITIEERPEDPDEDAPPLPKNDPIPAEFWATPEEEPDPASEE